MHSILQLIMQLLIAILMNLYTINFNYQNLFISIFYIDLSKCWAYYISFYINKKRKEERKYII